MIGEITTDDGYAFLGDTWSYSEDYNDMWIVKTDNRGNIQWHHTYGNLGADKGHELLEITPVILSL